MRYTKKLKIHIFDLRATDLKKMIPIPIPTPSLAGPARCNQKQIKISQHCYTFKNKLMEYTLTCGNIYIQAPSYNLDISLFKFKLTLKET